MKILFWISTAVIFYTYIGYPIIIYLLSHFYKKPVWGKYLYPMVSLIVYAHNDGIDKDNLLFDLDYPEKRIEVLVGAGNEEDKPAIFNRLAGQATGEILIFTDSRQSLDKNALKELVKYFSDPKVGSVSGELYYKSEGSKAGSGIRLYWEYEKFIRKAESRMGSMLGASAALYAVRKELFPPLPKDLILDDVYIPMKIVERGYRAIFDKKAKVYDGVLRSPKEEFLRKARNLAGNYQLFFYFRQLFNPFKGKISWQFFSHKFLRLMVPFLFVIVFISNLFLLKIGTVPFGDSPYFYKIFFILQIVFYVLAFLRVNIPYTFCLMNAAAIAGLYNFTKHRGRFLAFQLTEK